MSERQQILEALQLADQRLERLRQAILANPDARLLEGEWTVRDCLSHVAARANVASIVQTVEQRLAAAQAGQTVQIDINAINHDQVEERKGLTVEQILAEMKAGHTKARQELEKLGDDTLSRRVPEFRGPGDVSIGEMLLRNLQRHEGGHVDTVEAAMAAARRRP